MYYAKNFSLVFMLIGLSYCQTGIEHEEELSSQLGEGDLEVIDPGGEIVVKDPAENTPLIQAIKDGKIARVRDLLDQDAGLEITDNKYGSTPLLWAVSKKNIEIAKLLLEGGAKPDVADGFGITPLIDAVFQGNEAIAELLLEKDANPNAKNEEGQTP
ncbi:MAG: ankyrin repeat domain-containing protein, partial [Anaerolineales bacterium]|nr:ankyrin repeat domain-containing protein [Anaerolineales bacterium]